MKEKKKRKKKFQRKGKKSRSPLARARYFRWFTVVPPPFERWSYAERARRSIGRMTSSIRGFLEGSKGRFWVATKWNVEKDCAGYSFLFADFISFCFWLHLCSSEVPFELTGHLEEREREREGGGNTASKALINSNRLLETVLWLLLLGLSLLLWIQDVSRTHPSHLPSVVKPLEEQRLTDSPPLLSPFDDFPPSFLS